MEEKDGGSFFEQEALEILVDSLACVQIDGLSAIL